MAAHAVRPSTWEVDAEREQEVRLGVDRVAAVFVAAADITLRALPGVDDDRGAVAFAQRVQGRQSPWDREAPYCCLLLELRTKIGSALDAKRITTYCAAGAAAASLAHVPVRLGHPNVAVCDVGLLELP